MKRGVIYSRYSSNNQTEQSIEGQERVCLAYAKDHDILVVNKYADRAISGRTDNRPDFQRMLKDAAEHVFDAVIVYKTDRFARNKYDSAIYKSKLRKLGIELHYAAEAIPDGPEGIILESLLEGIAEYYSAELSQKIKRGMHESAIKGHATGGGLALGYDIAPDKSFVVNEDEATIVRKIFDLYILQKTNAEIQRYLNSIGFTTSRGKPFNKNSIPNIVKNEKYIGVYKCGEIRNEDAVPAIVSREVFEMAQSERKRRKGTRAPKSPSGEYLLSGKLFCGHCKAQMTGVSGTSRSGAPYYYYYCSNNRTKRACDKKQVPRDWLEDLVVNGTVKYILQPEQIQYISEKCYLIQLEDRQKDAEVEYLEKQLAEKKKSIANTLKAIESGVATKTLPQRLKELEDEQENLEIELRLASATHVLLDRQKIAYMLNQFADPGDDWKAYKKRVIQSFVSAVYLHDEKLFITYNISRNKKTLDKSELAILEDFTKKKPNTDGQCSTYAFMEQAFYLQSNTKTDVLMFSNMIILACYLK